MAYIRLLGADETFLSPLLNLFLDGKNDSEPLDSNNSCTQDHPTPCVSTWLDSDGPDEVAGAVLKP